MPDDRIAVVALDTFLKWRQWRLDDGHEVAVELSFYNEEEALAFAEEHEALFRKAAR